MRLYWKVGHALLQAKQSGTDPFAAIESIIPWDAVTQSVTEAQTLTQSEDFDYLHRIGDGYTQIRRYAPAFLDALHMKAAPAARDILDAVATLKTLNASNARKVPEDAPAGSVKKRWERLVFTVEMFPVWLKISAVSTSLRWLRLGIYWTEQSRHA